MEIIKGQKRDNVVSTFKYKFYTIKAASKCCISAILDNIWGVLYNTAIKE